MSPGASEWVCPLCGTAVAQPMPCPSCGINSVEKSALRLRGSPPEEDATLLRVGFLEDPLEETRVAELMESRRIPLTVHPATGELLTSPDRLAEARDLLFALRHEDEGLDPGRRPSGRADDRLAHHRHAASLRSRLVRATLRGLEGVAGTALLISVGVHLASVAFPDSLALPTWFFIGAHAGILPLWALALVTIKRLEPEVPRQDEQATTLSGFARLQCHLRKMRQINTARRASVKRTLSGCPHWMRRMVVGLGVYAAINFLLIVGGLAAHHGAGSPLPIRLFSGHWMIFYGAAMAMFHSAANRWPVRAGRAP